MMTTRREVQYVGSKQVVHVLMVEDDTYYFEYAKQLLGRRINPRFSIKRAASLHDAIACIHEDLPDLILLDLGLPDGEGMESLSTIVDCCEGRPIIVLTSSNDDSLGLQAVAMGAQDFLVKQNISNDSLVRCIRYAIERRRAEEQTQRLAVIRDFVATLAHDMRVPLLGADKILDVLLSSQSSSLSEEQEGLINLLKESNTKQLSLVQKLLEIYTYESHRNEAFLAKSHLPDLVRNAIKQFSRDCQDRIVFENHLHESASTVQIDEQAVSRMLACLLENALTYSDQTRPITVSLTLDAKKLKLSVHNFGHAIPEDIQENLFQKFWSGVPGKRYVAHTGLGLYLCYRIVQMHQGRISCQSDEERGTIITVSLPLHHYN